MIHELKVNQLHICVFDDKYQLGEAAADQAEKNIKIAIDEKGEAVVILATGASQFEFLDALINRDIDWTKVTAFHLDEYIGIPDTHPASFCKYLKDRILEKVGVGKYFLINGECDDVEKECTRLEEIFNQYTVDMAFTGIGENGHLAFNDPPASFDEQLKFKVVNLDEASRKQQLGEGWFKTLEQVPARAITMTIPSIMNSKAILCMVTDMRKAEAVKRTLINQISPLCPASILRNHPNSYLFLDSKSASLLPESLLNK
jgi:glucosamine-6-phosphate deaminase